MIELTAGGRQPSYEELVREYEELVRRYNVGEWDEGPEEDRHAAQNAIGALALRLAVFAARPSGGGEGSGDGD